MNYTLLDPLPDLGPNVQLTIPRTNFNLSGNFVPLYGDGGKCRRILFRFCLILTHHPVKYDHSTPPPAPSRRARCIDLPDVSPTEPLPYATLLPESASAQDRRSSPPPPPSSEATLTGDYDVTRKKTDKKNNSRPRPQPANFDKFTFWLNSVLRDLYPPGHGMFIFSFISRQPLKHKNQSNLFRRHSCSCR